MPRLSAFTPCGQLRMSSDVSESRKYYDSLIAGYNGGSPPGAPQFNMTVGGHIEATVYAKARALARAKCAIERAGNQRFGALAHDLLPSLEKDYGVPPGALDTIPTRQKNVGAAQMLPNGALPWNIAAQLRAIFGTDFVGYFPAAQLGANFLVVPSVPETSTAINALPVTTVPKWLQLVDPVVQTGRAWTVAYQNLDTTIPAVLALAGDVVMVGGENSSQAERVTVTKVGTYTTAAGVVQNTLTATFANSHDVGATVTTMNWPVQWSESRTGLIGVLAASCYDIVKRAKAHSVMARVDRAVSQWAIVLATPVNIPAGQYTLVGTAGASTTFALDTVPLGTWSVQVGY
jgi:hypothetical protein